mgnify:CR=1 FL=1
MQLVNEGSKIDRAIAVGAAAKPIETWAEVAAFVDEAAWERILGDLAPRSRAEALKARPCRAYPTERHLHAVPDPEEATP